MQVECINDDWFMDMETGATGITFKRGKLYETEELKDSDGKGDIIVRNDQGSRHVIKTLNGLDRFFNRHFRFV